MQGAMDRTHCRHQFVVRTPMREELKAHLEKANILCGILYPVPRGPSAYSFFLSALSISFAFGAKRNICSRTRHGYCEQSAHVLTNFWVAHFLI
jgi:hypothetical protein